jgi:hypothetical protein
VFTFRTAVDILYTMKHNSTISVALFKAKERAFTIMEKEEAFAVKELNEAFIAWIQVLDKKESKKILVRLGIRKRKTYSYCVEDLATKYVPFTDLPRRLNLFLNLCIFKEELDGVKRPGYGFTTRRYDFAKMITKIDGLQFSKIEMTLTDYDLLFN